MMQSNALKANSFTPSSSSREIFKDWNKSRTRWEHQTIRAMDEAIRELSVPAFSYCISPVASTTINSRGGSARPLHAISNSLNLIAHGEPPMALRPASTLVHIILEQPSLRKSRAMFDRLNAVSSLSSPNIFFVCWRMHLRGLGASAVCLPHPLFFIDRSR